MSINRNILIVVNPAAGRSSYQKKVHKLQEKLAEANVANELFYTEVDGAGMLHSYLKEFLVFDELVVMGGDGTLNYVVNETGGMNLPIGIVSLGSGNDSVKSIHGVMDFDKQVDIVLHGRIGRFDLGVCNERFFVNGVGIGFDGLVVKHMLERGGKRGRHIDYLLTVLRIIAGFKEKTLSFAIDGKSYKKNILLMTISNGTTFGGGFVINPFAKANDGRLDVCVINEIMAIKRFWHLPKLRTGAHTKIKEAEFYQGTRVVVEGTDDLVAHLDGEYIGHPPFDIYIEKEAILFRIPSQSD